MIVVSDTGPLNYLILIGHVEALPRLYNEVLVPRAVARELSRPRTPSAVKAVIMTPPSWMRITDSPALDLELADLGDGEREAITLAQTLRADLLLCDDKEARNAAQRRNLRVIGTIGVLQEAADKGLVDLTDALSKLQQSSFRISRSLIELILSDQKNA